MTLEENYNIEMALMKIQVNQIFEFLTAEQKEQYNIKIKAVYEDHLTEIAKYVPREDVISWWITIRHID